MHHRALRRAAPVAAALLGLAALPAPTFAKLGAPAAPAIILDYNTAQVQLSAYPASTALTISDVRDGATVSTATGTTDGTGLLNVNFPAVAPEVTGCWTGFTPEILPGDSLTITGTGVADTVLVQNTTAEPPVADGTDIVVHGTAQDAAGLPLPVSSVDALLNSKTNHFSVGDKGGQSLSASSPNGFGASLAYDAPDSTHWTARFSGLSAADRSIAMGGAIAQGAWTNVVPHAAVEIAAATTQFDAAPAVPGPQAGCGAPLGRDGVTGVNRTTVTAADAATALLVSGVADPSVTAVSVTVGGLTFPASLAGTSWTASVPPSALPEGALTIAGRFTNATGTFHGATMTVTKDTVAPAAPTASIDAGTYNSTQTVGLRASDGTIHYTTDGADPTIASRKYTTPISVSDTTTIKAIAIDAAGNQSPVAEFAYTIARPAPAPAPAPAAPAPAPAPKLRLDALTVASRISLRSARAHGLHAVIFAPQGAKVVRVRLVRNGRTIDRVVRVVKGDGVMTVALPRTRRAQRHLTRGTYRLLVTPGTSATKLGVTTSRTVRIR